MKIVALSDQHGTFPAVPACDLLIVAGDQCVDSIGGVQARKDARPQVLWFRQDWLWWRSKQPAEMCFATWGNHDYCGAVINRSAAVEQVAAKTFTFVDAGQTYGGKTFWFTPWSSQFRDWAFMQDETRLADLYDAMPFNLDVLVSHQPPYGYGDAGGAYIIGDDGKMTLEKLGSKALLSAMLKKRPKMLICGHLHGGHGKYTLDYEDGTECTVYNVALLNESYETTWKPTEIDL